MIMRVTWGKIRPGKWDDYEKLWKEHVRQTADTPGLKARWLLRDGDNPDSGYSLSLWDSAEDFDAYSTKEHALAGEMAECFVGQYVTTPCEVRGSDLSRLG
jgi:heme-degrading monooxygenase HmoA